MKQDAAGEIWRVIDWVMAITGLMLALIRLLGVFFFGATNSPILALPAVVMFVLVFSTISKRTSFFLLMTLVALYFLSYVFGGLERITLYRKVMPDLLEFVVIFYLIVRGLLTRPSRI